MKKLRYIFIAIVGLFFYSILLAALVRNIYLSSNQANKWPWISTPVKLMAEIPSLIKKTLQPPEFMVLNTSSSDGITQIRENNIPAYPKLLVSYKTQKFGQKFELIDLNNKQTLSIWEPDNALLFERAYNEANPRRPQKGSDLYFMHPFLMPDSSLIFHSQLTSLLVCIDKSSNIKWLKNDRTYHHTIEMDHQGDLFVCTQPFKSNTYGIMPDNEEYRNVLMDDEITKIDSESGEEIWTKPVMEILIENGFQDLIIDKGQVISDPIHLNDIQPAMSDTDYWQKDDLLISCRNLSTVFLYRPSTNKVIWLKQGPWQNQHDVDFRGNNEIIVFGNDVIREESTVDPKLIDKSLFFNKKSTHNEVYIYNFEQDSIETPYSEFLENEEVRTMTSGRCDILENGDLFVEDTNNGRILFGDSTNLKLEYVKRINENHISSLFWSRLIF